MSATSSSSVSKSKKIFYSSAICFFANRFAENLHAAVWVRGKHEMWKIVIQPYSVNIRKSIRLKITMWANSEKFLTKMSTVCLKKKTPTFFDRLFLFSLTCIRYTPVPFSTFKLFKHFTCLNNFGRPKHTSSQEKFSLRMTLFCMTSQRRKSTRTVKTNQIQAVALSSPS